MTPFELLRPIRLPLITAVALQIIAAALTMLPLLALIAFTGAWLTSEPLPGAEVIIAALIGTVGAALAAAFATWLTHRADAQLTWLLRHRLTATIRHAPLPTVTGLGAARIRKAVQDDTQALHYLVAHTLLDATAVIATPLIGVVALLVIDWRLALLSLLPLTLGIWWYLRAMRGSGAKFAEYASQQQHINRTVIDYVRGLPVAKIYGGSGSSRERYSEAVTGFHTFFRAWSAPTAADTTASWLVVAPGLTAAMFAIVGGVGVINGWLSTAAFIAGLLLGPAISAPVAVAGPRIQAIRTGLAALTAITEFLKTPRLHWGQAAAPTGVPELDSVSVRYGSTTALANVSLKLPEQGLIALVGASGSGKSTLAMLLARFADPDQGRIAIGGVDYQELAERELYKRVGFVFQNTALPDAPIREILTGGGTVSDDDVRRAAELASIHEVIEQLPLGYHTRLGDDTELSGGQRQRLALARALLRKPNLLVLDEVFSALDAQTSNLILTNLITQAHQRCVLLIAHQLHLTRAADRILVLQDGYLVGDGRHEQLLKRCFAYQKLWQSQSLTHTQPHSEKEEN